MAWNSRGLVRVVITSVLYAVCFWVEPVQAAWVQVSRALPESGIRRVVVDERDPHQIYALSEGRVYKTSDGGQGWKRIYSSRSKNGTVRDCLINAKDSTSIVLSTSRGLKTSSDSGKTWIEVTGFSGGGAPVVLDATQDGSDPDRFWLATQSGLWLWDRDKNIRVPVRSVPGGVVYGTVINPINQSVYCVTDRGVWRGDDRGIRWGSVLPDIRRTEEDEVSQEISGESQEVSAYADQPKIVFHPKIGCLVVLDGRGIVVVDPATSGDKMSWDAWSQQKIQSLAVSDRCVYAVIGGGVVQWDIEKNTARQMIGGLPTTRIHEVVYNKTSDVLYAATEKGVFRWSHPEIEYAPAAIEGGLNPQQISVKDINGLFAHEPSIHQVQDAAIRYAEVHPDKIRLWREAATKKALLPKVSFSQSLNNDENIDLDRGGTGDPDRFIEGPIEQSSDYALSLSWDLGEIFWNPDQTSIDTRSKLMAELREDVLREVTHLYFERRRLQVDTALTPTQDIASQMDKQIKLEELTAGIDGFTGGWFSDRTPH